MRVPADKEFRRPRHQASDNGRIVLSRIASDVFYEYFRTGMICLEIALDSG